MRKQWYVHISFSLSQNTLNPIELASTVTKLNASFEKGDMGCKSMISFFLSFANALFSSCNHSNCAPYLSSERKGTAISATFLTNLE